MLSDFLECEREVGVAPPVRSRRARVLDANVGSRAQQLQVLLARVQNTAVHIKDLSLGKLEHAATPGTALGVDGAVRARVRFASKQRCIDSDACRAEFASRCCQQLLAVRAMLATTRAATCCSLCARRCWRCRCPRTFDCKRARVC